MTSSPSPRHAPSPTPTALARAALVIAVAALGGCDAQSGDGPTGASSVSASTDGSVAPAASEQRPAATAPTIEDRAPADPKGANLLDVPLRGKPRRTAFLGDGRPEFEADQAEAPDGESTADLLRFGGDSGFVLFRSDGVPAAGGTFHAEVWVRSKSSSPDAALDVFIIDEAKDMAYGYRKVTVGDDWQRVSFEHTFEASESDAPVALRIGNGFAAPAAQEVFIWRPWLSHAE